MQLLYDVGCITHYQVNLAGIEWPADIQESMMSGLSAAECQLYREQGYVIPQFSLSESEVDNLRTTIDRMIEDNPDVRPEHLVNAHLSAGSE